MIAEVVCSACGCDEFTIQPPIHLWLEDEVLMVEGYPVRDHHNARELVVKCAQCNNRIDTSVYKEHKL